MKSTYLTMAALCFLFVVSVGLGARTIVLYYDGDATYGTYKVVSDEAGTATLTVDAVASALTGNVTGDVTGAITASSVVKTPTTIANGAGISTQTVAAAAYVLEPSAVHTQRFAAATAGTIVVIKNNAATNVFIDVAAGDVTLGDNDVVTLGYLGGEWITVSTKDN